MDSLGLFLFLGKYTIGEVSMDGCPPPPTTPTSQLGKPGVSVRAVGRKGTSLSL